jgi:hypothetical protein
VIAAVLERDPPPVSSVKPMSPPTLDRVVKTCIAKDPDERFQNVHDVELQLKWIAEGGSQAGVPAPVASRRKNGEKLAWSLMCGFAILAAVVALWAYLHPRPVAKEDAARAGAPQLGFAPNLARAPWAALRFWQQPRILAYASLILVLGLTTAFFTDARYRRSELVEARRVADDWQRRYDNERQARETLQKQMEQSSSQTQDKNPLVASLQPTPLFFLNVTRGSDQEGSPPTNHVVVPAASPSIALSLEFEKDPAFRSYRAQLRDSQGRILWSSENIPSPPSDAIAITLPSHLLAKGNYSVALDGLTSTGRYLTAARFSFQATTQK